MWGDSRLTANHTMKITIEYYRALIVVALICFMVNIVGFVVPSLDNGLTIIPLILCCVYGALVGGTNIKNGHIKAYGRKKDIGLTIPFQQGGGNRVIAYDDNGNCYKLGILFIPKKCDSGEL